MYAYLADAFNFQPEHRASSSTVFSWIRRLVDARRARIAQKRELAEFSRFERSLPVDAGSAKGSRDQAIPNVFRLNPYVIAMGLWTPGTAGR